MASGICSYCGSVAGVATVAVWLVASTVFLPQDVNPPERFPETDLTRAQSVISYIGGVISSIFLLVTALTYLFSK